MNSHSQEISNKLIQLLNDSVIPFLIDDKQCYERLSEMMDDVRIILMGEATHGTLEFYRTRMALSQYLIENKGFQAIAIEGDWASVYPIHRYCQGQGEVTSSIEALRYLKRFPAWMWCNTAMQDFIEQLQKYNDHRKNNLDRVGIYGLDLYCLNESAQAVIDYLKEYDVDAAKQAENRYACFDHACIDPQLYGYLTEKQLKKSCLREVTTQLLEIYRLTCQKLNFENDANEKEKQFYLAQHARVVKNAEHYYRSLFEPHHVTWNIRDQHMADTLQNIISHIETITGKPAKVIIWAHNSHIGDARATELAERQEINLGQLVRERFGTNTFSLGFSTATGIVAAASDWGRELEYKSINPPIHGSFEWFFHQINSKNFLLNLREETQLTHLLKSPQLQRAIGVIYRPETERMSHYYFANLSYQFDAIIHYDETQALTSINCSRIQERSDELPETYPQGF